VVQILLKVVFTNIPGMKIIWVIMRDRQQFQKLLLIGSMTFGVGKLSLKNE